MKKLLRSALSLIVCVLIAVSSLNPAFAAVTYPQGVTAETAGEANKKTDILVKNAALALEGKSLKDLVLPELYKDETLSSLLTGVYSSLEQSQSVLSILGIDISVKGLSKKLAAYPEVSQKLSIANGWSQLKLENAKWNVNSEKAFADAMGAILSPFNDVLYMLLCSGIYRHSIIFIPGDKGYEKGLISMLEALGCTEIASASDFVNQAASNKNTMISNIVTSLLSMLKGILDAPSEKMTTSLPVLADYIKNGGLEESVNALLRPLTIHIGDYIQLFTGSQMVSFFMFVSDPGKYTLRFSENITVVMNDLIKSSDIVLPEIDLEALISCKGNTADAYTLIFCWLIDALKLNEEKIFDMLGDSEDTEQIKDIASVFLDKDTDSVFRMLVELFTAKEGTALEYEWQSHTFSKTEVAYTENLSKEQIERVLNGIDDTIGEFIVGTTEYKNLGDMLKGMIYSPSLLTTLVTALYGAFSSDELAPVMSILSIPVKPSQLAVYLTDRQLSYARSTLNSHSKWESIKSVNWGFKDGDANGFKSALTAILRPFRPLIEALLANGTVEILESINIGGSNGYNTAVIPLLEALGCPANKIKTYDKYVKGKGTDKIITDILNPIFALLNKVIKKPVKNLTGILPNLIFFIDNGSLIQCGENLLYPVMKLVDEFSIDLSGMGLDIDKIKNTDLITLAQEKIPSLIEDIKLPEPDLKSLEGIGELTQINSKRTLNGERTTAEYVKADQPAVLMTILRYVIGILGDDESGDIIGMFMGGIGGGETPSGTGQQGSPQGNSQGGSAMFDQYSSGIGEEMADMTTDEIIEWLYKLFFRERATVEEKEEYIPTIIYKPVEEKKSHALPVIIVLCVIIAAGAVLAIIKRNEIGVFIEEIKEKRAYKNMKRSDK